VAFSRGLEGAADRAVDQRVLEQLLRELSERVLALFGEPVPQPVVCHRVPPADTFEFSPERAR
jgi:hypothetical protein